jgi:hypothetical protein
VNNVVSHPRRAAGSTKTLSRKIAADRASGIAELRGAIELLRHLASEPRFGFARGFIRECEVVLVGLEALDPDDPPCFERVVALCRRLENLQAEFLQRIICVKPDALSGSRELPRSGAGNVGQIEVPVTPKGSDYP